ncbi:cysteine proteinase COT44-like [Lycium ferocissimum]|uniref:cysteine proteinase COT44-like n=1 Tax=Lycium ferocissimum TaxID=112874 RepID=UPI0028166252|nr:cysteine proteinase COT44-like [Lycium ferocissimum]
MALVMVFLVEKNEKMTVLKAWGNYGSGFAEFGSFFNDDCRSVNEVKNNVCKWSWVGKGCLCAVEDQGKCWACWAFVAAEAITALYHIKLKEKKPLSKQQVINCLFSKTKEPKNLKYCEKTRCFCSHYNKYYKYAMEEGIYSDRVCPYFAKRKKCRCDKIKTEEKTKITGFDKVENLNLDKEGIEKLIEEQPLSGCMDYVESFRRHKGKEIYTGQAECDINPETLLRGASEPTEGRHAVLVVGYGVENGIEYYLIKNSWGVNWGYGGYARVERSLVMGLSFPKLD